MGLIHRNRPTRPTVLVASLRDVTFGIGRAAMLSILGVCSASAQSIIHVPADQPTIQAGINAASNGDTVLVSPGTYNENIDYKGKGITVTSGATAYSGATATIINGSTDGPVVNLSTNEPSTTVLNGFTIEGAHAFSGPGVVSAGVAISGSSATVSNNIITQNLGCGVLVYNLASPVIEIDTVAVDGAGARVPLKVIGLDPLVADQSAAGGRAISFRCLLQLSCRGGPRHRVCGNRDRDRKHHRR